MAYRIDPRFILPGTIWAERATFQCGDKVQGVFYGELRTGVVSRQDRYGVVWVDWDTGRRGWAHADSLTFHPSK